MRQAIALQKRVWAGAALVVLGLSGAMGCSPASTLTEAVEAGGAETPPQLDAAAPAAESDLAPPAVPAGQPQLVKQASLTLEVESIEAQLRQVTRAIAAEQGDILDLRDSQDNDHSAFLRVRVPQAQLESLMARLADLGTVEQRSITAEDVSTQLVDLQARIRNLRKSEAALLDIMERSGNIADVLEVSRELSSVRQQIEQLDAQDKHLRTRVAYSTLELTLIPVGAPLAEARPLGSTLGTTWQSATRSVGELTTGLLQLGLWLIAYSPYLAVVAIATALGYRSLRRRPS